MHARWWETSAELAAAGSIRERRLGGAPRALQFLTSCTLQLALLAGCFTRGRRRSTPRSRRLQAAADPATRSRTRALEQTILLCYYLYGHMVMHKGLRLGTVREDGHVASAVPSCYLSKGTRARPHSFFLQNPSYIYRSPTDAMRCT